MINGVNNTHYASFYDPINNYSDETNTMQKALNKAFVLSALDNDPMFQIHTQRANFENELLSSAPVFLSQKERIDTHLNIFALLNGKGLLQQSYFQLMIDSLDLNEPGDPSDQQNNLLYFLSKAYLNTRDPQIKKIIETWFDGNFFTIADKVPVENSQKIPVFCNKRYNTLENLPVDIKTLIAPLSHLGAKSLIRNLDYVFPQEAFKDNPVECFSNIMNEFTFVLKEMQNNKNTNPRILTEYLHALVKRTAELIQFQPYQLDWILTNRHKFNTAGNKPYFASFIQQLLIKVPQMPPLTDPVLNPVMPEQIYAKLTELLYYFQIDSPVINLNLDPSLPNISINNGYNNWMPFPPIMF